MGRQIIKRVCFWVCIFALSSCDDLLYQRENERAGRSLVVFCRIYASDHGGEFPGSLSELEEQNYVEIGTVARLRFRTRTGLHDWIYFGRKGTEYGGKTILLCSEVCQNEKSMAITASGDILWLPFAMVKGLRASVQEE